MIFNKLLDPIYPREAPLFKPWLQQQIDFLKIHNERENVILLSNAAVDNTDASETDFLTLNVNPAESDNYTIDIFALGVFGNNADNKTIRLYYGGDNIFAYTISGSSVWVFRTLICVAATSLAFTMLYGDAVDWNNNDIQMFTMTEVFNAVRQIKITGQSATATVGNVGIRHALIKEVKYVPVYAPGP